MFQGKYLKGDQSIVLLEKNSNSCQNTMLSRPLAWGISGGSPRPTLIRTFVSANFVSVKVILKTLAEGNMLCSVQCEFYPLSFCCESWQILCLLLVMLLLLFIILQD